MRYFADMLHISNSITNCTMAAPAVQPRLFKTELVMWNKDRSNSVVMPTLVPKNLKLRTLENCNAAPMTEQEAEAFFAICENPSSTPIEMFSKINEVAKWFKD